MTVIKVDSLNPHIFQRRFATRLDIIRRVVRARVGEPELGRNKHILSLSSSLEPGR